MSETTCTVVTSTQEWLLGLFTLLCNRANSGQL
jgi:hypothetical protein